jgi:putative nucleotidyltransferase with HDIG domain
MGRESRAAEPPASNRSIEIAEHCTRVAAWAVELATLKGLPRGARERLREAGLAHHYPPILLSANAKPKLLADLCVKEGAGAVHPRPEIAELLQAFHGISNTNTLARRFASVLEHANALDEWIEAEPFRAAGDDPAPGGLAAAAAASLRAVGSLEIEDALDDLPVMPKVAQQVLSVLRSDNWTGAQVERLASSDMVLAGQLIQCANSAAFGSLQPVSTISRAVSQLGAEAAIRLLMAASLRPAFASPPLYRLWNHSLVVAAAAQQLAESTGQVDPGEAFLAGLVHDVGRLAILELGRNLQVRLARLIEAGCDLVSAEFSLCGMSHADIGELIMNRWRFPVELIAAVKNHHRPEAHNPLAAILYMVEEYTQANEHRRCTLRRYHALETLNADEDLSERIRPEQFTPVNALKFAA